MLLEIDGLALTGLAISGSLLSLCLSHGWAGFGVLSAYVGSVFCSSCAGEHMQRLRFVVVDPPYVPYREPSIS